MHDAEIGRWWYPQCIGGIYGKHGCTCPRGIKSKQDKIDRLEQRIDNLEKALRIQHADEDATITDKLFDTGEKKDVENG